MAATDLGYLSSTAKPGTTPDTSDLDFFFDPACPFAWLTSRWIHQVMEARGITVNWRFICLAIVNEETETGDARHRGHLAGLGLLRVCAAVKADHGSEVTGRLYTAIGTRIWNDGESMESLDVAAALADAGLDPTYASARDDESWDQVLREETELAIDRCGHDIGTPVITYGPPDGNTLFGPVISSLPDPDTALRMYDAVRTLVDFEAFSEVKRTKRPPLDLPALRG